MKIGRLSHEIVAVDPEPRFSDATLFWESARSALLSPPTRSSQNRSTLSRPLAPPQRERGQSEALPPPQCEHDSDEPGNGDDEHGGGDGDLLLAPH